MTAPASTGPLPPAATGPAPTAEQVAHRLWRAGVLPVLRTPEPDTAHDAVHRLARAGVTVVELTATTPQWPALVRELRASLPDLTVGLGTVRSSDDAETAVAAGAHFLVTPFPVPGARAVSAAAGVLLAEGAFSPGEVAAAAAGGLAKLFPAHVGGPAYLRSLLAVLPEARVIPTGGIGLDAADQWLEAGAFAVGVGGALFAGDLDTTAARLARYDRDRLDLH
ncbi:bifunctional 4-hydroxy-2-oxoglutarate aldolase/2-dehydro-3-deoxy-phosphogluconate aldolase [Geodermatophilus sp. DSM 44513]|uniref:bifunctional 4-hydroxy-2-oxoglutarate aldolase/2-dehydro-3-deoxy-phosphogluconate aldolase n=1 Tax=Geodermatophilus sp. DSM 44513 TaxID=1528104 RepID=UPI001289F878|nr:bifunctional 4-hydroxy-2-oxoglutarate aldolase/2-dehydro-3-deoxy-phosphogluconate aldolase [Geodermatophilus sp. DSM 44513]WNV75821.1 bifunctional 4-hydroxy-2-oxoglutarate aldolase/2-dehydro-3-deoxy-phosphogluconate aldolase [Geodermatophilus sp. DSM 44513]